MTTWRKFTQTHRHTLLAFAAAGVCFALLCLIWLAAVRPNVNKSLSTRLSDEYSVTSAVLEQGESASQTFTLDEDLLALAFVFAIPGEQPSGELELVLRDADSGAVLARSSGEMANILPGQYTGLGLDTAVAGRTDAHYEATLTPHYTGAGRLALGGSDTATLWEERCVIAGAEQDTTLALLVTTQRIGGFLTRYFLLVGGLACLLVFLGVRTALQKKLALHRLVFVLVLGFGLLYSAVLPPYAAPDERYHINQSFTLACRWANVFSPEDWRMGDVPLTTSYRRAGDFNALLQNENTTVFTWRTVADNLLTTTTDAFDSHVALEELQTDRNPLLYLASAAAVFIGFLLHLGFVPVLYLGRLANLLVFALLAAFAIKRTPFGKRVFAAAALLPMTLHLAASFSRDAVLLGLCFAFTALCMQALFGRAASADTKQALPLRILLPLGLTGVLLAPAKVVYLPLAALALLVPKMRLGAYPWLKRCGYLAACLLLALGLNRAMLSEVVTAEEASPPEQTTVAAQAVPMAAAQTAPSSASQAPAADTPAMVLPQELTENTTEAFVRRLYFCAEGNADPPVREVENWVQALTDGDVDPALLGQGFFFSPTALETVPLTDDEFITAVSLCYLGRDILQAQDADNFRAMLAEYDRVFYFKAIYGSEEAANRFAECGLPAGDYVPERYPLDRSELAGEVETARAVRATQSTASEADRICYTPAYVLTHIPDTVLLVVRSVLEQGDNYLRTLVGGSLSYHSLDMAWGWVLALYLLLAFAALPAADSDLLPQGRYRLWGIAAALGCCLLAVAGCIAWTPTYYQTIYGLQGRYFLPVLPLLLLLAMPRTLQVRSEDNAAAQLVGAFCLVNTGVLVNAMLAVMAR